MRDQTIEITDVFKVLSRNFLVIVLATALCCAAAFTLTLFIPKQFKSRAVLSIQAGYFQNPLVSNMISETTDPTELNAQRAALLRMALTTEFLDDLGERYGLYKFPRDDPRRAIERELFLKKIEFFSTSQAAFQIAVTAPSRIAAFEMTKAVLARMIDTLADERMGKLLHMRNAIEEHLKSLNLAIIRSAAGKSAAVQDSAVLQAELSRIQMDMQKMMRHFTDRHPAVARLRSQEQSVRARLQALPIEPSSRSDNGIDPAPVFLSASAEKPVQEMYDDLLKKLSNIEVVLNIEKDRGNLSYLSLVEEPSIPTTVVFPQKRVFVTFGFLAGLALASILVVAQELRRGIYVPPYHISDELEMPLLGEMPVLKGGKRLLLEAPANGTGKLLPWRTKEVYQLQ